jgi:predicted nucleic acid-binding protein
MSGFVLDASVAVGWFVDQPISPLAVHVRDSLLGGSKAIVPAFWHLEVANGLLVAERRGLVSAEDTEQSVAYLEQLLRSAIETDVRFVRVSQAADMARRTGLTPYDVAYLDLCRAERAPLATLDQRQKAAAVRAGVELLR